MFSRRFFARVGQLVVLFLLLVMMVTTVLSTGQPQNQPIAVDPTPTPTSSPDGWGDPVGG